MTDLFHENCPHCHQPMPQAQATPFDLFWDKVPKIGKAAAQKAWKKLTPQSRRDATDRAQAFYDKFRREHPQASTIHPATYLNGRRWEDEGVAPVSDDLPQDHRETILRGLSSPVPAVQQHADKMARLHGVGPYAQSKRVGGAA